jgi:MFS family permease
MKLAGESESVEKTGLFYGWVVVGCCFTLLFLCFGVVYTFGGFFQAFQQEFQASRGDVSLVFAISGFLYFILGAVTGPLAERVGVRRVVVAGVAIMSLGLVLASRATALWQIYLTYGFSVGLGVGLIYVPSVGTVQRWFIRQRGLASGIATAGIGAGNLALPPVATGIIALSDWRVAYLVLAATVIIVGLVAAFLLENSPQQRGLLPDNQPLSPAETIPTNQTKFVVSGATLKQALTSRFFWLLYLASLLLGFGLFIPFVHLAPYARDKGLGDAAGVWLIGLIGLGSTLGRFFIGGIADRLGRRQAMAATFGGISLSMLWWLVSSEIWSLAIFTLVFGLCYGGFVALAPAITADYFGRQSVSSIIGFLYTSVAFGTLFGPPLAGVAFDLTHSYTLPIICSALASGIGVICLVLTPTRPVHQN